MCKYTEKSVKFKEKSAKNKKRRICLCGPNMLTELAYRT